MKDRNTEVFKNPKFLGFAGLAICLLFGGYFFLKPPNDVRNAMEKGYYGRAFQLLEPMAQAGDDIAQNQLGILYNLGLGVEQDQKLASKWFLASALQENSDAQINIGQQYQNGRGLRRDDKRAYGWYRQARFNSNELGELHLKLFSGKAILGIAQIQEAVQKYGTLEDLIPSEEKGGY